MPNFKPSRRSSSTTLTVSAQPPSQNARRISHPRLLWLSSANNNLFFTQAFDSHNSINIHYKNSSNVDQLFYACQPLKQQRTVMFAKKKELHWLQQILRPPHCRCCTTPRTPRLTLPPSPPPLLHRRRRHHHPATQMIPTSCIKKCACTFHSAQQVQVEKMHKHKNLWSTWPLHWTRLSGRTWDAVSTRPLSLLNRMAPDQTLPFLYEIPSKGK